ncbi:MAG: (Na+)-NQR maturation NqrM [Deltaproteobacteria bacterium]|nr:(Na+)-NQR maturation NqrM [Deltaproteobacteria bacterium]
MIFLSVFAVFLLVFVGMGIGVLFGRPPPSGSCGGLNRIDSESGSSGNCQICGASGRERCKKEASTGA